MNLIRTMLAALDYPHVEKFQVMDGAALRALVAWLENTKIHHYTEEDRRGLNSTHSPDWPHAFAKYLADLECPVTLGDVAGGGVDAAAAPALLRWLLAHAVALEYEDHAEEYNKKAEAAAATSAAATAAVAPATPSGGRSGSGAGARTGGQDAGARGTKRVATSPAQQQAAAAAFSDWSSPQVQQGLREVLRLLHVDGGGSTSGSGSGGEVTADQLEAARVVVRDMVLPSLTDKAAQAVLGVGGLQQLPLGFETGDPAVDAAARLLRLLYIRDLRELQSAVDEAIVSVQELTANPKTDSALGKVGR